MKLWGVAMVRNEADIIEAFVRHNLAFLDGLVLLDHRSNDGTFEKIGDLEAEGLPIERLRTLEEALYKARHMSSLTRSCFEGRDADFVFALDADEFIAASSRATVEAALAEVPPGSHALHLWRSYIPTHFNAPFGPQCLRTRLREEMIPRAKVIISRSFMDDDRYTISEGNHWVVLEGTRMRAAHHVIAPDVMALAHCPVRNAMQLEKKASQGYHARLAAGNAHATPTRSAHWREICEDMDRGIALTHERLRTIAANYTIPRPQWVEPQRIELVEDPVELQKKTGALAPVSTRSDDASSRNAPGPRSYSDPAS